MQCPKCNSDDTRSVQMVLATGTQQGSALGFSYSSGGSTTSHASAISLQSNLASKYSPGPRPSQELGLLLIVLGAIPALMGVVIAFTGFPFFLVVFLLLIAAVPGGIGIAYQKSLPTRNREWQRKTEYSEQAWVCLRCGADWTPSNSTAR